MVVVVDSNSAENEFATVLSTQLDGIDTVDRASLPVADIDIRIDGFRLLLERKTIADFAASIITDGRYHSQNCRAREVCAENIGVRFGYLITGCLPAFDDKLRAVPASTIFSALSKLQLRDGFVVLVANTVPDGAKLVAQIVKTAKTTGFAGLKPTQTATLGKRPRDSTVPPLALALASVNGVSIPIASKIVDVYPTAGELIHATVGEIAAIKAGKRSVGACVAGRIKALFC